MIPPHARLRAPHSGDVPILPLFSFSSIQRTRDSRRTSFRLPRGTQGIAGQPRTRPLTTFPTCAFEQCSSFATSASVRRSKSLSIHNYLSSPFHCPAIQNAGQTIQVKARYARCGIPCGRLLLCCCAGRSSLSCQRTPVRVHFYIPRSLPFPFVGGTSVVAALIRALVISRLAVSTAVT